MIQLVLLSINSIYSESGKVRANHDHDSVPEPEGASWMADIHV